MGTFFGYSVLAKELPCAKPCSDCSCVLAYLDGRRGPPAVPQLPHPGTPTFVVPQPEAGGWQPLAREGGGAIRGLNSSKSCWSPARPEAGVNRRGFLAATVALAWGQGQKLEGEDLGRFQEALKKALNIGISDLRPSADLRVNLPDVAELGTNVPLEVECGVPAKAIYAFCDRNPTVQLFTVELGSALPFYATRVRMAETAPVRVVVATQDARFLWFSKSVQVTQGGCG